MKYVVQKYALVKCEYFLYPWFPEHCQMLSVLIAVLAKILTIWFSVSPDVYYIKLFRHHWFLAARIKNSLYANFLPSSWVMVLTRPPIRSVASSMMTSLTPFSINVLAAVQPAIPAPIIATLYSLISLLSPLTPKL